MGLPALPRMLVWSVGVGMEKRTPDAAIAEAMNRVLAAERGGAEAIAAGESLGGIRHRVGSVAQAPHTRHGPGRATRLHVQGQSRLEQT